VNEVEHMHNDSQSRDLHASDTMAQAAAATQAAAIFATRVSHDQVLVARRMQRVGLLVARPVRRKLQRAI